MQIRFSQLEWHMLEALWADAPLSATEIYERIADTAECTAKSVRTLADRLRQKGAIRRERRHGVWVFFPAVERDDCVTQESRSFLQRFFGAEPVPMVAHLVEHDLMTPDDIEALRKLLDEQERKKS